MKAPFSPYLNGIVPWVHQLVDLLGKTYDYVSVLSTDSVGFTIQMSQRSKSVTNSNMTTERGNVVRVAKNGLYSEYAFNEIDQEDPEAAVRKIRDELDRLEERLQELEADDASAIGIRNQIFYICDALCRKEDQDLRALHVVKAL